jgi:catechol 2,3-dioxygenase-like lactoylglutathione lyase family enzyme
MERKRNMTQLNFAPRAALHRIAVLALAASLSTFAVAQTDAMPPETKAPAVSPSTLPFNGIAHIAIRVKDIAASVAFYNKLGFQQAFAMTKGDVVTQSFIKINDKQFIELYPINPDNPTQGKPEFLHLCFEGVDLNAIHDAYVAEGLTPIAVRKAGAGNLLFTMKGPQQFAEPQNIEYTQYQPESLHSKDIGLHVGSERIADKMVVVTLAMQDPAAASAFYRDKLGFAPVHGPVNAGIGFSLPGNSGQLVDIVPVESLGSKAEITLETANIAKAESVLTAQKLPFIPSTKKPGSAAIVTDPDGNVINIRSRP